jgi:hypothetical protein
VKREAEELITKLRTIISTVSKSAGLAQLKTKREQLKVINESIQQCAHRKLPVPDDLPRLKKSLIDEIEKAEKDHLVLYFLKDQLSQMLAAIEGNLPKEPQNKGARTSVPEESHGVSKP